MREKTRAPPKIRVVVEAVGRGDAAGAVHQMGVAALLPVYLGLSEEEYDVWVCDPFSLPHILAARRSGRRLAEMMAARFEEMRRANHPSDSTILFALGNWLKAHRGH